MNILIATLSILPASNQKHEYKVRVSGCDEEFIEAAYTNESILKCMVNLKDVKESNGIEKYILLVSNKVKSQSSECFGGMTALDYYKVQIESTGNLAKIYCIDIESDKDEPLQTHDIVQSICENIAVGDKVYIDCAGGLRTMTNVVQILSKLLRYTGIEVSQTLYANFQNEEKFIVDTAEFDKMLELADAFNEFMTTGKSRQLNNCFQKSNNRVEIEDLLSAMNEFSDRIRLGYVEDIDKVIKNIQESIQKCKSINDATQIEDVILRQFLPVIQQRLVGNAYNSNGIDYIRIIQWCLDNMLVQQALTLFVEKVPISLFQSGCIKYKGDVAKAKKEHAQERQKNKTLAFDWEVNAFYSDMFSQKNNCSTTDSVEFAQKLKERVLCGIYNDDNDLNSMYTAIMTIKKNWSNPHFTSTIPIVQRLCEFRKKNKTLIKFEGFVNSLCNEPTTLIKIRDGIVEVPKKEDKTLENKFKFIKEVRDHGLNHADFVYKGLPDKFVPLLCAYVYAKATRNQINHASSNENLSTEHKEFLKVYGYTFDEHSFSSIEQNLAVALQAVKDVVHKVNGIIPSTVSKSDVPPTTLMVGDIVHDAIRVSQRQAEIPGHHYPIQIVVSRHFGKDYLLPASFSIKIKQISTKGKITQAEYIPS